MLLIKRSKLFLANILKHAEVIYIKVNNWYNTLYINLHGATMIKGIAATLVIDNTLALNIALLPNQFAKAIVRYD